GVSTTYSSMPRWVSVHLRSGRFAAYERTWAKGMENIAVTLIGIGKRDSFRNVGGDAIPELGSGTMWVSQTPFVPPRFLKPHGNDSVEGQIRAELERRGLPDLAAPPAVAVPRDESH